MRSALQYGLAAGTAICVAGLSFQVLAAAVTPIFVQGSPSVQEVAQICQFPKVINKDGITSPVELSINNPPNNATNIFPSAPLFGIFQVQITVTGSTFEFVDFSQDPGSPDATDSQFFDVQGTEAVVAESGNRANVYCNVNSIQDSGLTSPQPNLSRIRVFWVIGPSGFVDQAALDPVCTDYQDPPSRVTDIIQGYTDGADPAIDISGCLGSVPRFCNAQDTRLPDFVVACPFGGGGADGLLSESTILGNGTKSSGGTLTRW